MDDDKTRAAKPIADKIYEMLAQRERGLLKRSADDFISGLVKGFALVLGIDDQDEALQRALWVAQHCSADKPTPT